MIFRFFCFLLAFSCLFAFHAYQYFEKRLPKTLENQPLMVQGTISALPEKINVLDSENESCYRTEFEVKHSIPHSLWKHPGRIRVTVCDPKQTLEVGDVWQFYVKLKRPHAYANPGSFNKELYFFQNRWVAEGRVLNSHVPKLIKKNLFSHPIDRLRMHIQKSIAEHLDQNDFVGIVNALVIGSKEGITQAQWSVFRATGTAHLMAISGLHLGLMLGFALLFFSSVFRFFPKQFFVIPAPIWTASFGLCTIFLYALLAGFSIPTQRAFIMITFLMLGTFFKTRFSIWGSYVFSLTCILLWDPFSILSIGFWLSFSAVGLIIYGMQGRLYTPSLWWRFGRAQGLVFVGLMPFSLLFFQQSSLVSPLANIVAIPWVGMTVVPSALLGGIFSPTFAFASKIFLNFSAFSLKILWVFLEFCKDLPFAQFECHTLSVICFIMGFLGIVLLLAPRGLPAQRLAWICFLPICFNQINAIPLNTVKCTVLDVGQGLACVLETAHHLLLFDTGPKLNDHYDMGSSVVVPFLKRLGYSKVDMLVLSHGDSDHIGGMDSIAKAMPIHKIVTSDLNKVFMDNKLQCYAGQKWHWDGVDFEMLHPHNLETKKTNDQSCVLKVSVGSQSILLTGDIESPAEQILLSRSPEKLSSNILLVPHHGSKTSSTLEFLQAVNPQYAIVSAGYLNAFGHPRPEIVERYQKQGIIFLETAKLGAITFILKNESEILPPRVGGIYTYRSFDSFRKLLYSSLL